MQTHRQLALILALLAGCTSQAPVDPKPAAPTGATTSVTESDQTSEATVAATEVTLKTASLEDVHAAIAKHKGKVVVCDYWSTSCEPCVKEFPHLVALSQKHSTEQLVCVAASLDFDGLSKLDSYREPVLAFLKEKHATTIENFLMSDEDTAVYEKLKLASIPAVYVYGADGELKNRFDESSGKAFSYEHDINPLVEELIKAAGK